MALLEAFQWGGAGQKLSPKEVAARRQVAAALAARNGAPKDIGEGLNRVGEALLYRANMSRADAAEQAGRARAQETFAAMQSGGDPMAAFGDEWLMADPGMSAVAQAMLSQKLKAQDPSYQLDMDYKRAQLAQMNQPDWQTFSDPVTGDMYRYDGRDPASEPSLFYDAADPVAKAPAIPSGYQPNPEIPGALMPIPGGPEDTSVADAAAAEAAAAKAAQAEEAAATTVENTQRAVQTALSQTNGLTAGNVAGRAGWVPLIGQGTTDLSATLDTIKANLSFEALAAMRAASPTGGALGSITERELALLGSTIASLDATQSPQQLAANLTYINSQLEKLKPRPKMPEPDENGVIHIDDATTIRVLE